MKKLYWFVLTLFLVQIGIGQDKLPFVEKKEDIKGRSLYYFQMLKNPITGEIPKNIREKEIDFVNQRFKNLKNAKSIWQPRGPWNVGGRTRAIVIDYSDTNRIIAGGVSGGIWVSEDYGNSWTKAQIPDTANSLSVVDIAQDPTNPNVFYYAGGEYIGNSASEYGADYRGTGIFRSTDGGYTWTLVHDAGNVTSFDSHLDYVWNLEVDHTGRLWIAAYGGIYISDDGGYTLTHKLPLSLSDYTSTYTDIAINDDNIIVVYLSDSTIYGSYVFVTPDTGAHWYTLQTNWGNTQWARVVIAPDKMTNKIFYFLGVSEDEEQHLLAKLHIDFDNYIYWFENLSDNLPYNFDSQGGYDLAVAIHPADTNIVYIGGTNLYFSLDGFHSTGNTYQGGGYGITTFLYTNHHPDVHVIKFNPLNPNTMISGHDGGISITFDDTDTQTNSNGETIDWVSLNNGYQTTQTYHVSIDHSGTNPDMLLAGFQDNGSWFTNSSDYTQDWILYFNGDGGYNALVDNGKFRVVSSQYANIYGYKFNDQGSLIGAVNLSPNLSYPLFVTPFVFDPNDPNIMYTIDYNKVYRNTQVLTNSNPQNTWEALDNTTIYYNIYTALAISTNPANILFAGTAAGRLYKIENANVGDPTPVDITGSNFPNGYIVSIAVDPDDANKILVAFSNYGIPSIFYTEDGGTTWTDVSGNLEENPNGSGNGPSVRAVAILKTEEDTVYLAGTSVGLFSTTSLTPPVTWVREGSSIIGNAIVTSIQTRNDGTIVIGTHGNGIFSTTYSASSKAHNIAQQLNIWPNPAKDMLQVNLPEPNGKLLIYTMDGKLIYFSTPKNSNHSVNVRHFSPGVYFVRYIVGKQMYQSKLIVE